VVSCLSRLCEPGRIDPMKGKSGRDIELFTEAVQLPIEERIAFLGRACAEDEDLRLRIEAWLKPMIGPGRSWNSRQVW